MRPIEANQALTRVLIADSNQTQSHLMCSALRRQRMRVISCKAELSDCLSTVEQAMPDVALIGGGTRHLDRQYDMLRALHTAYPRLAAILLVEKYDRELVVNAMRYGARGIFCSADQPFKSLCRCIWAVTQGQVWINTEQIQYVLDALVTASTMPIVNAKGEGVLTSREDQLVALVAECIINREIAERMSIKENTVKKSLLRIYDKIGVSNRVELVLYALTHRSKYGSGRPLQFPAGPDRLSAGVHAKSATV